MRNGVIARDSIAEIAATQVFSEGGNAVDAVLGGMLASAALASTSALMGSARIVVAGPGMGAYCVDGLARMPGLSDRRRAVPDDPPGHWRAAVPGLCDGVLTAHNRFGTVSLGTVTRAAAAIVLDSTEDKLARARAKLVKALAQQGSSTLERLGVRDAVLESVSVAMGGTFTKEDLEPAGVSVVPLDRRDIESFELYSAEEHVLPTRNAPPAPPKTAVDSVLALDMHGVMACAMWALPEEATPLRTDTGLSLAALAVAPRKGVPRWKAGEVIPFSAPALLCLHEGRAWHGVVAAGSGDARGVCSRWMLRRIATTQAEAVQALDALQVSSFEGLLAWIGYSSKGEVTTGNEAVRVR